MSPWLHLQTDSQHHRPVAPDTELVVEAAISDLFEKKGHEFDCGGLACDWLGRSEVIGAGNRRSARHDLFRHQRGTELIAQLRLAATQQGWTLRWLSRRSAGPPIQGGRREHHERRDQQAR